ncbi:MAG: GNAT family protein [Phreatobacter sp.]|uniref:GNAT family N-acetyltransferase n=1 Tax=Phreatobacter sp. TaxID=1966341 RepID=UPI00273708CE|nr:GNAT family protein [Phreatobacter sp.]MDP2803957.1 GNAT family protein [Phreatobacter sp.]
MTGQRRSAQAETGSVRLRRAEAGDLDFVIATERLPHNELRISQWPRGRHEACLGDPDYAYWLVLDDQGRPLGYAILRGLTDRHGNIALQRISIATPGQGTGRAFLVALADWAFAETACHRFWFDVFTDNAVARALYRAVGFIEEGVQRESIVRADGRRASLALMSTLRPEWQALRAAAV